jgi:hypothetical protein
MFNTADTAGSRSSAPRAHAWPATQKETEQMHRSRDFLTTRDTRIQLRRTHQISWMISGWIAPVALGPHDGGTACLTIGCPDDFVAVRLGFASTTPGSWKIDKAIGCASNTFNDYVNPTGPAEWISFTFACEGRDDRRLVTKLGAPTDIIVAGNIVDSATGEATNPTWTWTDWTPISSTDPDPATGMRVLMLRALVPSGQIVCFANSQLRAVTGNVALNHGFDCFIGGIKFNYDKVTDPKGSSRAATEVWRANQLTSGSLFPIVQFLTRNAGIVGATTGDSHHQGTSTTDQMTNYLYRATTNLGSNYIGKIPFGMMNCAVGGLASRQFFPRLEELLSAVRPSYVVLPGWSYNDHDTPISGGQTNADQFVARLIRVAEICRDQRIAPVFLTPFPRDEKTMSKLWINSWQTLRRTINDMKSEGSIVLDASLILGHTTDGELDGTYLAQVSDDGVHPNDLGHSMLAENLISVLRETCQ